MPKGRRRKELTDTKCKHMFQYLNHADEVLLVGDKLVILTKLKADILALAPMGHPGREFVLQQLKEEMWWLRITKDLKCSYPPCIVRC